MNIAVLAGGLSTERNVSITSGKKVAAALRGKGHNAVLLDVFLGCKGGFENIEGLFNKNRDFIAEVPLDGKIPNLDEIIAMRGGDSRRFLGENVEEICRFADICFLALHGDVGENGKLQAAFDLLGIRYTGSGSFGSALAMNKGVAKSIFLNGNIPTPKGAVFTRRDIETGGVLSWNDYPCVVKPCSGGSSVGVSVVNCPEDFISAVNAALGYEEEVLVEEFIKGREFSVGVLDDKALPVIEIIPKVGFYDYINKYQSGRTQEVCPADLDSETALQLQSQAVRAFKALHLNSYARIDFLLDKNGRTYCLEANTLPGMTPVSLLPQEAAAAGINYEELCEKIIDISLKKYGVNA